MSGFTVAPAVADPLATVDRLGADVADPASQPTELRPELRPLLQRIASLEERNRELETLAEHLKSNVEELAALVYVDALTGLVNRRGFDAAVESELRRAARTGYPLALLLCDIDCFKHCNDTHGHSHGDSVLVRLAALLKDFCKREGDCAARYGGEEFALLLPGVACKDSVRIAEQLRKSVAALSIAHAHSQSYAQVTISIGATSVHGSPLFLRRHLVEAADAALYRAKRAGRNRTKYQAVSRLTGDAGIEPVTSPV